MFCPTCGSEERQPVQYCRACGTDLRLVRVGLQNPDVITASANPRDHISRAIADKIRETQSPSDLKKVAEEVLPEIEKFLETPAERRLRRIRTGVIFSSIGLGAALIFAVLSTFENDFIFFIGIGTVLLFLGLGIIINGLAFTRPRKEGEETDTQRQLESTLMHSFASSALPPSTSELDPNGVSSRPSVTEHTTHHLKVDR